MASNLKLVHLAFNRLKELSLKYGDSIPHRISIFNGPVPAGPGKSLNDGNRGRPVGWRKDDKSCSFGSAPIYPKKRYINILEVLNFLAIKWMNNENK
jgi:hypothetical protein